MKNAFILLLSVIILGSCTPTQRMYYPVGGSSTNPMPGKPGSCYAKVFFPSKYSIQEDVILAYTGTNPDQEGIQIKETLVAEATTKWEKRKADGNCQSANPDDCLVWCLVQVPEVWDTSIIVTDTTLIKDFEIRKIQTESLASISKYDWAEVLCENKLTKNKVLEITTALKELGYMHEPLDRLKPDARKALKEYQTDNQLPSGALTLETLDHLGVSY